MCYHWKEFLAMNIIWNYKAKKDVFFPKYQLLCFATVARVSSSLKSILNNSFFKNSQSYILTVILPLQLPSSRSNRYLNPSVRNLNMPNMALGMYYKISVKCWSYNNTCEEVCSGSALKMIPTLLIWDSKEHVLWADDEASESLHLTAKLKQLLWAELLCCHVHLSPP